jgi:Recombinase
VKRNNGDTTWRCPNYATIHRMIDNPIYGGAYGYGKTAAASGYSADRVGVKIRRKARTDWLALMPNAHEGYVSWERAEAIRKMVSSHSHRPASRRAQAWRRAPRWADPLSPLRAQADAEVLRRQARHPALQLQPGLDGQWRPSLHRLKRLRVDDAVENASLTVVGPGAIAAATAAEKEVCQRRDQVHEALGRDLEAARYAADRAFCGSRPDFVISGRRRRRSGMPAPLFAHQAGRFFPWWLRRDSHR